MKFSCTQEARLTFTARSESWASALFMNSWASAAVGVVFWADTFMARNKNTRTSDFMTPPNKLKIMTDDGGNCHGAVPTWFWARSAELRSRALPWPTHRPYLAHSTRP